jgi:hypothetical protein
MSNSYLPKKVLITRPLEFWNTIVYHLVINPKWTEQVKSKGYFNCSGMVAGYITHYELKMKMNRRTDKEFKELIEAIIDEHFQMTKKVDHNLHFLWHMYKKGTKAGDYKPFMLMAEMQLLKEMGYISAEEIQNMWAMIDSKDEDNFHLVWLAVRTWRLTRIKEHGVYSSTNLFPYMNIEKDYPSKILNHEVFLKTATTHNA